MITSAASLYRRALLAWLVMTVAELLLYFRPTPSGASYVLHWHKYFFFALLYNIFAIAIVTVLARLALLGRATGRRVRGVQLAHLIALVLILLLDHADHEVQRFMGTHLTVVLLTTYAKIGAWGADPWQMILGDRGGPFLGLLVAPLLPALLVGLDRSRHLRGGLFAAPRRAAAVFAVLAVASVAVYFTPGGWFRKYRVQPEVFTLAQEFVRDRIVGTDAAEVEAAAREWPAQWQAEAVDREWSFPDPRYPLYRTPTDGPRAPAPEDRWNIVYLQLETYRGWDVGFLRPDRRPSATPYLDELAASPLAAYWTRHSSFGPPTISGFIAGHCSIQPHSRRNIATNLTGVELDCLPALLRRHGYRAEYFTASDPDWDNQTYWLQRWYDATHYYLEADEDDRPTFRRAAARIRELGRGDAPFMATLVSISNHFPFRSREPGLAMNAGDTPADAILNTMRYTDDVLREFIESLRDEPWFSRTVFVIVGDHGYNLAEHTSNVGDRNGHRESVWVPLVIYGGHPRVVPGAHTDTAALTDLAPTLADMLGIREANAWMGHSLLRGVTPERAVAMERADAAFAEDGARRYVREEHTGELLLFDAHRDPLERDNLAGVGGLGSGERAHAARLARRAHRDQVLVDGLLETDHVVPPQARAATGGDGER